MQAAQGYTLLELLIVMAIVGLAIGVATPPFLNMLDQQRRFIAQQDIERSLGAIYQLGRQSGRDVVIRSADPTKRDKTPPDWLSPLVKPVEVSFPAVPEGWTLVPAKDIWVRFDGVCGGGEVSASRTGGIAMRYDLAPPFCTPKLNQASRQ